MALSLPVSAADSTRARPRTTAPRLVDHLDSPFWILVAGVLLGLSFPPLPLYGLAYVALVPLLIRWSRFRNGWALFREAYSVFLLMAAVAGHWVLLHQDTLTALTSGVGLLLLPLPMSFAVAGSALVLRRHGGAVGFAALVAFSLSAEYFLAHGPVQLPWLLLGNTQATALPFNQFAELTGVTGLSLWIWLVNGLLFWALNTRDLAVRLGLGLGCAALLVGPVGFAQWRLPQLHTASPSALHVGVIQPAVEAGAWADGRNGARVELLADLSEADFLRPAPFVSATPRPDLLVWPEAALPAFADARQQRRLYGRLQAWTAMHDVALLTGAITRFDSAPAPTVEPIVARQVAEYAPFYNSALLFDAAAPPQQYDKIRLAPFSEEIPFVRWQPALAALGVTRGAPSGFASGRSPRVFHVAGWSFGALIAAEGLFGDQGRRLVGEGAEFLVVLAQNGWWGRSAGYRQHVELARLRAIETRRPVLTAAVSGRSGLTEPDGSVRAQIDWMERGTLHLAVPRYDGATFYVRHGDWLGELALLLSGLLTLGWGTAVVFFPQRRGRRPAAV